MSQGMYDMENLDLGPEIPWFSSAMHSARELYLWVSAQCYMMHKHMFHVT